MNVNATVSLTEVQDAFARALVAEGRYESLDAVLQDALDLLREESGRDPLPLGELRVLLEERAKGPFIPSEEFNARFERMLAAKRTALGLEG